MTLPIVPKRHYHFTQTPWKIRPLFVVLCIIFFCCFSKISNAQVLAPNQPEQDACNALGLCGNSFSTPYSYQGAGKVADLNSTPCSNSAEGGEVNVVWLKLKVATTGVLVFNIIPIDTVDDYDFAVLDISKTTCSSLTSGNVVRCNYNNNYKGSNMRGIVGLSATSNIPYVQEGATGNSFCQYISAVAGQTYLIMINNYGSDYLNNSPSSGFTIDFTGSTATFEKNPPPALDSIGTPCTNATSISLHLSVPILCSSIAADGSDFVVAPFVPISGAKGINCNGASGYTDNVVITFATPLSGAYTLKVKQGLDGNTLLGLCSDSLVLPASLPLNVPVGIPIVVYDSICYNQLPFLWNGISVKQGGNNAATFISTGSNGCNIVTVLNLTVSAKPDTTVKKITICDGKTYHLPWDSTVNMAGNYSHTYHFAAGCDSSISQIMVLVDKPVNINTTVPLCRDSSKQITAGLGFSSYNWNNGTSASSIIVNATGVYTAKATDTNGCVAYDTFRVAVSNDPVAALAKFTQLCAGTTESLDAGSGFKSYLWSDGSTLQTLAINTIGNYWVTVTDANNCPGTDTTTVSAVPLPAGFLRSDTVKCFYSNIPIGPIATYGSYLWNTGETTSHIHVMTQGIYTLQVTDANGCVGKDSINVTDSACQEYIYVPTAFTPNGDGKNDLFKPTFAGALVQYNFVVYNRYGSKVFSSSNPLQAWDGTINGQPQPPATYVWICSYQLYQRTAITEKGTVVLIR